MNQPKRIDPISAVFGTLTAILLVPFTLFVILMTSLRDFGGYTTTSDQLVYCLEGLIGLVLAGWFLKIGWKKR